MPTSLITGANRGIGLSLARALVRRGDRVIGACRKSSPALDGLGVVVESNVDVTSDESVAALARRIQGTKLDLAIMNAGILRSDQLGGLDFASLRAQFEVNSLGPLRMIQALLPNLERGSKVALVTSRMGSIADNSSGGSYGYRMSKAALNAAGVSLARDLAPRGIAVAILHPGYVKTDMTDRHGNVEPDEAARMLIERIDQLTPATSGTFWHANGEVLPW